MMAVLGACFFSLVWLGMLLEALSNPGGWPFVVFGATIASAYVWFLFYITRLHRSYRLRLLPDGLRLTEFHRTSNCEPQIVKPELLPRMFRIRLSAAGARQPLDLALKYFEPSDQLAIIEHCSLYLTPEQQVQHGKEWVQCHARLLRRPSL